MSGPGRCPGPEYSDPPATGAAAAGAAQATTAAKTATVRRPQAATTAFPPESGPRRPLTGATLARAGRVLSGVHHESPTVARQGGTVRRRPLAVSYSG